MVNEHITGWQGNRFGFVIGKGAACQFKIFHDEHFTSCNVLWWRGTQFITHRWRVRIQRNAALRIHVQAMLAIQGFKLIPYRFALRIQLCRQLSKRNQSRQAILIPHCATNGVSQGFFISEQELVLLGLLLHRHVGQPFETSEGLVITRAMSCGDFAEQAGRDDSVADQLTMSIGLREQIVTKQ
ncbi:Uncharacterised protein [Vibrio cholerae]|uniref:Uncharacterized protein n=1 Tax=Vibrio cholerae TaxID=666 RepID=A0A655PYH2_VIBCL|nr:Uncharacterised protein [Vibrio cholerae]CSA31048.1 Uncharacterised protein [Vibrio cholerae]CSA31213.1 Uncharacterised protein [Vibrio cholerae]CSB72332.1 Uncharacterised protein [Vibrio cholerae]CSB97232.1 Uncharacterised protein [Vibrio cholerae]